MSLQLPDQFQMTAARPDDLTDALWFIFNDNALLVILQDERAGIPRVDNPAALGIVPVRTQMVGILDGVVCMAAETLTVPDSMSAFNLRRLYGNLDDDLFAVAARAVQLVDWDRTHQFCGRCAMPMDAHPTEHAKICPECALRNYPRLAPAVIVAVTDGDRILLGNNARYRNREMYSVLAGFVEAGETLEQTVAREIKEEVGIDVTDIRYFGSQPWPFPHSLMLAFTATYAGGELQLEEDEIRDAAWFTADAMPIYPSQPSIANDLIEAFIAKYQTRQ